MKKVLRTSLRWEIQATDSTCCGCTANSAATKALGPTAPVIRDSAAKSASVEARWNRRLVTCIAPGFTPNNCTSSISESHVSGCQKFAYPVVNAQATPGQERPATTWALPVT